MRLLLGHGASAAPRGRRADTPLLRAAKFRKYEAAELLLTEGHVEVDHANRRGDTALLECARAGGSDTRIAELLVRHGASLTHANNRGMTAALEAADSGSLPLLKLFHSHGASMEARTLNGDGALELSRWARDSEEVGEWLRSVGVQPAHPEHGDDYGDKHGDEHEHEHYG